MLKTYHLNGPRRNESSAARYPPLSKFMQRACMNSPAHFTSDTRGTAEKHTEDAVSAAATPHFTI